MQAGTSETPSPVAIARRPRQPSVPAATDRTYPRGRPQAGDDRLENLVGQRGDIAEAEQPAFRTHLTGQVVAWMSVLVASGPTAIRPYVAARRTFSRSSYGPGPAAGQPEPCRRGRPACKPPDPEPPRPHRAWCAVARTAAPPRLPAPLVTDARSAACGGGAFRSHPVVVVAPQLGHVLSGLGHVDAGHRVHAQTVPIDLRNRCVGGGVGGPIEPEPPRETGILRPVLPIVAPVIRPVEEVVRVGEDAARIRGVRPRKAAPAASRCWRPRRADAGRVRPAMDDVVQLVPASRGR